MCFPYANPAVLEFSPETFLFAKLRLNPVGYKSSRRITNGTIGNKNWLCYVPYQFLCMCQKQELTDTFDATLKRMMVNLQYYFAALRNGPNALFTGKRIRSNASGTQAPRQPGVLLRRAGGSESAPSSDSSTHRKGERWGTRPRR